MLGGRYSLRLNTTRHDLARRRIVAHPARDVEGVALADHVAVFAVRLRRVGRVDCCTGRGHGGLCEDELLQ